MLTAIQQTLIQNAPKNASQNASQKVKELKTPDAIMALIQENKRITRQQMANILSKDIRTIGRAITKLQQANMLQRVGSSKTGHWKISK